MSARSVSWSLPSTRPFSCIAESTDNARAISVLKDFADEERVHAGEFLRLLHALDSEEGKFYAEGAREVEEEIEKLK